MRKIISTVLIAGSLALSACGSDDTTNTNAVPYTEEPMRSDTEIAQQASDNTNAADKYNAEQAANAN